MKCHWFQTPRPTQAVVFSFLTMLFFTDQSRSQIQPAPSLSNHADSSDQVPNAFDVISIKLNNTGAAESYLRVLPDGLNATNISLRTLLSLAYAPTRNFFGLPKWAEDARFDIAAKVVRTGKVKGLSGKQRSVMIRTMLVDRFNLVTRVEMRRLKAYDLVVKKSGPLLHPANNDRTQSPQISAGSTSITATNVSIAALAGALSRELDREVVDRTHMTGLYTFTLQRVTERSAVTEDDSQGTAAPSVFTALQEQLGLALVDAEEPMDVIVVETVSLPTPN